MTLLPLMLSSTNAFALLAYKDRLSNTCKSQTLYWNTGYVATSPRLEVDSRSQALPWSGLTDGCFLHD